MVTNNNVERPTYTGSVQADWIDANGHMNVSYYDWVFDAGERELFDRFGIHDLYIRTTRRSIFRLEKIIRYERELKEGDRIEVRSFVIWTDMKRIHHFHEIWNINENYRAATNDGLSIHVALELRRSVPIHNQDVSAKLRTMVDAQSRPAGVIERKDGRRS